MDQVAYPMMSMMSMMSVPRGGGTIPCAVLFAA
jgi:hypothetical protein